MTVEEENEIRKCDQYKFWKGQIIELNSTLDLDIYVLPMIIEQMYNVFKSNDNSYGYTSDMQSKKNYDTMKLACEDWEPFNGIDGYGGSLDDVNKLECDPESGCC